MALLARIRRTASRVLVSDGVVLKAGKMFFQVGILDARLAARGQAVGDAQDDEPPPLVVLKMLVR